MINVVVAKNAGYCFGVKRAVEETKQLLSNNETVYVIGDLIHNEKVVNELKQSGLVALNDYNEIKNLNNKQVIIRSHGIEKQIKEELIKNKNYVTDLTCPFVSKIQSIVYEESLKGNSIIVIGDKNHPEIKSIVSYSNKPIEVINSVDDIKTLKIPNYEDVTVVFQTTSNIEKSKKLVDILHNLYYNLKIIDTICKTTRLRQDEANELSKKMDCMLVIGGKTSSNTKKLYDIVSANCKNSFLISDKSEFDNIYIEKNSNVGVCAGASTPPEIIEEILSYARTKF